MSYEKKGEKVIANYPMEKFSPFDYESFEFGGIIYSTRVRQGEFVEEAFERAQNAVNEWASQQFEVKRLMFVDRRVMTRSNDPLPKMNATPIVFTPSAEADEDEDDFDEDEDAAFRPKATADAGDKLTLCYGIEAFAPIPFNRFEVGGQFYTTYVRRRETATDAYARAWQVIAQVAHRQFLVKAARFQANQQAQAQAKLLTKTY